MNHRPKCCTHRVLIWQKVSRPFKPIPSIYLETPDGEQGIQGQYFDNNKLEGEPLFIQTDDHIDFVWDIGTPDPRLKTDDFSIRWTGFLKAPKTGTYLISGWGKPFLRITYNGKDVAGGNKEHHASLDPIKAELEAGKRYKIEAEYRNYYGDATARLLWGSSAGSYAGAGCRNS
ncbi:MAG: PA14 domain-containing protein [Mangrovibacterium sp.]